MKRYRIGILFALTLSGCQQPSSYTINGSIREIYNGATILMQYDSAGVFVNMDSVQVTEGSFSFTGKESIPKIARIALASPLVDSSTVEPVLFVLENTRYRIQLDTLSVVTGNSLSEELSLYLLKKRRFEIEMQRINNEYMHRYVDNTLNSDSFAGLRHSFASQEEGFKKLTHKYINRNYENTIGIFLFNRLGYLFSRQELESMIENSPPSFRKNPIVRNAQTSLATMKPLLIGSPFQNVTMYTANGTQVELSKWAGKGRYVLLYVWASWGQDSPEIIDIINKIAQEPRYKQFIYIGVSMDTDDMNWQKSIAKEKPKGLQVNDLNGWYSSFALLYNIDKIPYYLLIGPLGILVAEGNNYSDLPQIIHKKINQ